MPADHRLRLENSQRVQHAWYQPTKPNKYQPVDGFENLRRSTLSWCRSTRISISNATRERNSPSTAHQISLQRSSIYNRRFLQMCSHYIVEPVACTPASGWEKGQVENQVGLVRERFFTPRLRFKTYDELNAWLADKCVAYAKAHRHPELAEQTVWEVFEAERPKLVPYAGRF